MNLRMEIFRLSREKGYTTGYGVKLFLPTGHQQAVVHCCPSNRPPTSCYSLFSFQQATTKLLLIVVLPTGHQQAVGLPTGHHQAVAHCCSSNRPPTSCCSLGGAQSCLLHL